MDNESLFIEKADSKIQLLGIEDPDFVEGMYEKAIPEIISEELNSDNYSILLSHRPEYFDQYVQMGTDLVLAGHAHGGQVRIPFIGGLIALNQGLFPNYTAGLYHEKNTDMIVSRGLGNSIVPVRINNTPELMIVELKLK